MRLTNNYLFFFAFITCLITNSSFGMEYFGDLFGLEEAEKVDVLGEDGLTPFMRALASGSFDEAQRELKKKPTLKTKSSDGRTIFDIFLAAQFTEDQQAALAKELILLSFEQDLQDWHDIPEQVRNHALRADTALAALLHSVVPNHETERAMREHATIVLPAYLRQIHFRREESITYTFSELVQAGVGSFFLLYMIVSYNCSR